MTERPLRVLVDTLSIQPGAGGVRVYLKELLVELHGQVEATLICSASNVHLFRDLPGVHLKTIPWSVLSRPLRVATQQLVVPALVALHRPDLLFAPIDVAPLLAPARIVTCVHSSHINAHLGYATGLQARYGNAFMWLTVRRSRRVIAISEYVKDMTVQLMGARPEKIDVIYHGGGLIEHALEEGWAPPEAGEREGGILFLSSLHPHKNAQTLVEAYGLLTERLPDAPPLTIAGRDVHGETDRLRALAASLKIGDRVMFAGRVSDAEVLDLLGSSRLLVYPSTSEGFGLPVLEAMQAGLPVITSDRASLPEIVGEAGLVVPAFDAPTMADAMYRVLTDPSLQDRLSRAGQARGASFTWSHTAEATLALWRRVARRPGLVSDPTP